VLDSEQDFSSTEEKPEGAVFEAEEDSDDYVYPHTSKIQRIKFEGKARIKFEGEAKKYIEGQSDGNFEDSDSADFLKNQTNVAHP
jgi:hypothetical protein